MQEVGIRVLKDNLSSFLKLVKNGEIIYIKDRNEIIAEIRKPNIKGINNERFQTFIQEQILKGNIKKAITEEISDETKNIIKSLDIKKYKKNWREIYIETREDRIF